MSLPYIPDDIKSDESITIPTDIDEQKDDDINYLQSITTPFQIDNDLNEVKEIVSKEGTWKIIFKKEFRNLLPTNIFFTPNAKHINKDTKYSFIQLYHKISGDRTEGVDENHGLCRKPSILTVNPIKFKSTNSDNSIKIVNVSKSNIATINIKHKTKSWHIDIEHNTKSPIYYYINQAHLSCKPNIWGHDGIPQNNGLVYLSDDPSIDTAAVYYNEDQTFDFPSIYLEEGYHKISKDDLVQLKKIEETSIKKWFITYCIKTHKKYTRLIDAIVWGFSFVDGKLEKFCYSPYEHPIINTSEIFKKIMNKWNDVRPDYEIIISDERKPSRNEDELYIDDDFLISADNEIKQRDTHKISSSPPISFEIFKDSKK